MVAMKVGSLCSGGGLMDYGLELAGMEIVWQAEIDKYARKVLRKHFPEATLFGDIQVQREYPAVDLIAFGFPCQDISTANTGRKGLAGSQSGLFFDAMAVMDQVKPAWLLIENVAGLLSSNNGRDMDTVVWELAKRGYWWAYRLLDSRYFGVPQSRHRVYIVGHLGSPVPPEILFEPKTERGNVQAIPEAGQKVAYALTRSNFRLNEGDNLVTYAIGTEVSTRDYSQNWAAYAIRRHTNSNEWGIKYGLAHTLDSNGGDYVPYPSLDTEGDGTVAGVARWLDVPLRCRCPDAPRYRITGNGVTVQVAKWIGERILKYGKEN